MVQAIAVCQHVSTLREVTPRAEGCEECLAAGETWVDLRLCLTCGHVGCCNDSSHKHAQRHFAETGHPVIRSLVPHEDWMWCYVDDVLIQGERAYSANAAVSKEMLRRLSLFSGLTDADVDRLYDMAKPIAIPAGTVVMEQGDPGDELYVVLEGTLDVTRKMGDADIRLGVLAEGDVIGEMAVLEAASRTATVRAIEDSLLLTISQAALETLLSCSSTAALSILRTMTKRLRSQEAVAAHQEKMASLGTLSAGLAHELNNPAAAIHRSVAHLGEVIEVWDGLLADLAALGLQPSQIAALRRARRVAEEHARAASSMDALLRSEQEDALQEWLEDHAVSQPWEVAPVLLAGGWDEIGLQTLAEAFSPEQVPPIVSWIATLSSARELLRETRRSSEAISDIVGSVKRYSHLDEAPVREIEVRESLESALGMLQHKLASGVVVQREYTRDLPPVEAYASELNQVWTNLIDNAIDATGPRGTITIRTRSSGDTVVVEIQDDGPGIPPEIQSRIFDAFFTTKPPGVGSGLGLHIVYNIVVHRHRGEIRITSEPGKTRFDVELPLRQGRT